MTSDSLVAARTGRAERTRRLSREIAAALTGHLAGYEVLDTPEGLLVIGPSEAGRRDTWLVGVNEARLEIAP